MSVCVCWIQPVAALLLTRMLSGPARRLVVLAGDISPLDILSHIPVLCEETDNPYIFVTSKDDLGAASSTKRPTSCVMICPGGGKKAAGKPEDKPKEDYSEDYNAIAKEVKQLVSTCLSSTFAELKLTRSPFALLQDEALVMG